MTFVGGTAILSVNITKFTLPTTIRWSHESQEVSNASGHVTVVHSGLDQSPATSTVVISPVGPGDGGTYLAIATNPAGETMTKFEVIVYGKEIKLVVTDNTQVYNYII